VPRTRRLRTLPLLLALAIFVGACGETDDPSAPSAGATTTAAAAPSTTAPAAPTTTRPWPLTAPAPKLPATITDANGATVTITNIDRIASLQGDITEILWTLGLGDKLAVVDTTSVYPDTILKSKPNAGFFRTLSAEGLLAQKPTVVLAHPGAGPAAVLDAVRASGVPVVILPELNGTDLGDAVKKIKAVGEAVGLADHATSLATQVEADIAAARAETKAKPATGAVAAYIVPRGTSVFLTGLDSPSNAIIAATGANSVAKLLGLKTAAPLTPEALIGAQPTHIVSTPTAVAQAGGDAAFLALAGIAETPAGKNKRLIVMDDQLIQQFGPRTGKAVRELSAKLAG
jgi:iron complex transport system substrate-binding protein